MKPVKNNSTDSSLQSRTKIFLSALFAVLILLSGLVFAFAEGGIRLKADFVGARSVKLSWSGIKGADGYKVYFVKGEEYKTIDYVEKESFTVKGLDTKTAYSFLVRAYSLKGKEKVFGQKSETVSVKTGDIAAPSPSAEYVEATSTKLGWEKVKGADGYRVYRSQNGGAFKKLGDIQQNACIVRKLAQGTKFSFKIRAYYLNKAGGKVFGPICAPLSIKTGKIDVSGFKASKVTADSISFTWNRSSEADGYSVYRKEGEKLTKLASTKETSFTLSSQTSNRKSSFLILAFSFDASGRASYGNKSKPINVRTFLKTPSAPKETAAGLNAVNISWDRVEGAKTYKIFLRAAKSNTYSAVKTVGKSSAKVEKLSPGEKYYVRVQAFNKNNHSGRSVKSEIFTKPKKLTGVRISDKTPTSITVRWDKNSKYASYVVYSSRANESWKKKGVLSETKFTLTGAKPDTTYSFKIIPFVRSGSLTFKGESSVVSGRTNKLAFKLEGSTSARKGEYLRLRATGTGVSKSSVSWSSSNSNIVRVNGSKLLATGVGSCTVTAKCGGQTISKYVSISSPVLNYMAAVYDVTNGDFIFQNRLSSRCYPGSVTKLVTALVAVKYCSLNSVFTVGSELNMVEGSASRAGISSGERFTLEQLLYGLLVPSGCDCAYTIAVNVARRASGNSYMSNRDASNYFASMMNSYMRSIGCTGSHMVNPHGYPNSSHYTTTGDMILVARKILSTPILKTITSTRYKYVTALSGRGRGWSTTNGLMKSDSQFYCPYTHGMKTGTVNNGYANIISVATKNGRTIITAVFGTESYNSRYNATWKMYNAYLY